jgi:S1-C subfamily serine protease
VPAGFLDWHFGFKTNLTNLKAGIVLTEVAANSPAAKAGLQKGDRITAIAGKTILDMPSYAVHLWSLQPGENVQVTFVRDKKKQQVEVRTAGK